MTNGEEIESRGSSSKKTAAAGPSLGLYAICLERAPERWQEIRENWGAMPWPLERVPALDATKDTEAILARRGQELVHDLGGVGWNPLRYRMFSLVEEAIFCSHLLALERFLASANAYAVVLEDDALPLTDVAAALQAVLESRVDLEVVKLEGVKKTGSRWAVPEARLGEGRRLVRSFTPSSGAAAYLVSRPAAEKLLANVGTKLIPYDDYLCSPALSGCRLLHLSPYPIRQAPVASFMAPLRRPVKSIKRPGLRYRLASQGNRLRLRFGLWRNALFGPYEAPLRLVRAPWQAPAFY